MAPAFGAMNDVYCNLFHIEPAEAAEPGGAIARANALSSQFIVDIRTHLSAMIAAPGLEYFAQL